MSDARETNTEATDQPLTVPLAARALQTIGGNANSALSVCFIVTTVAGGFSEYLGNIYGAISSMAVFLAYGWLFWASIPNKERFADSAYYQGFILTLFALLMALTGNGAHIPTSDSIILQFGLAIWTTLIGMTARILIIQFHTEVADQDELIRKSISRYVKELNDEIETTLAQLETFRDLIVNSVSKVASDLADEGKKSRKQTGDALKSATGALVRSAELSASKLDQSIEQLVDRISSLDIPSDVLSKKIHGIVEAAGQDLSKLNKELGVDASNFANALRANVLIMEATKDDLTILKQSLTDVNRFIQEASRTTSASLLSSQTNLAAAAQAQQGVEHLGKTAETLAQHLTALSAMFDGRAQSYKGQFDKIAVDATAAIVRAHDETNSLVDAVVESAQKITNAVREVGRLDAAPK